MDPERTRSEWKFGTRAYQTGDLVFQEGDLGTEAYIVFDQDDFLHWLDTPDCARSGIAEECKPRLSAKSDFVKVCLLSAGEKKGAGVSGALSHFVCSVRRYGATLISTRRFLPSATPSPVRLALNSSP